MSEPHDTWDDPKYVKPAHCDEFGYCVDCRSATVHRDGCIVLTGNLSGAAPETGLDRVRAAIEQSRGMHAPNAEEIRALTGCCAPPEGLEPPPPAPVQAEPIRRRLADVVIDALFCPACIRFRFGPGHLMFCDGGKS